MEQDGNQKFRWNDGVLSNVRHGLCQAHASNSPASKRRRYTGFQRIRLLDQRPKESFYLPNGTHCEWDPWFMVV